MILATTVVNGIKSHCIVTWVWFVFLYLKQQQKSQDFFCNKVHFPFKKGNLISVVVILSTNLSVVSVSLTITLNIREPNSREEQRTLKHFLAHFYYHSVFLGYLPHTLMEYSRNIVTPSVFKNPISFFLPNLIEMSFKVGEREKKYTTMNFCSFFWLDIYLLLLMWHFFV